ncbi:hypothetical protein C0J52_21334 [Blattella germanica]|nr:hypothetical protein C0J52_21334 [Blattella germanica]
MEKEDNSPPQPKNTQDRPKRQTLIGTKKDEIDLLAAEKTAWLFVGRLQQGTTADKVKNFLNKNGIHGDITCEEIVSRGNTKAYKVGVPFGHLELTTNPDFWPAGVTVRRFRFRPPGRRYEGVSLDQYH